MINRSISFVALAAASVAASLLVTACSVRAGEELAEDTQSTEAAATATECADSVSLTCDSTLLATTTSMAFTVDSVVGDTITGRNGKGQFLSARFNLGTAFRIASPSRPTDPYLPGDPYKPAAIAYNNALQSGVVFTDSSAYATYIAPFVGGKARVWVDKRSATVRAFRPVPTF